jgi:V/A-type H+-transporting ATPase subunit K
MKMKNWSRWLAGALFAGIILLGVTAAAQDAGQTAATPDKTDAAYRAVGFGVAAALAVGLSILGAGYAVGRIGSAAVGALVEKPELLPRTILFIALGEGLAVLGFAFAMMLLQKI